MQPPGKSSGRRCSGPSVESLGDLPPRPSPPRARIISRELRPGYALEKVSISNGVDGDVTALLLLPASRKGPVPAILWLHSSTPDKTQVIIPGTNGGDLSLGEAFVRAGYAVLSPDAYWHGDRAGTGPSGTAESGRAEQEDLFKLNLWLGRTLWGMFVRDDQVALDYLCSRPEVDASRIGATGMSMGSTRAWWLAAVDERVAAVVAVACLTRYQNLIAHGDLRQHGVYYFVNGLLRTLRQRGRARADRAPAVPGPDRRARRRLAGRRSPRPRAGRRRHVSRRWGRRTGSEASSIRKSVTPTRRRCGRRCSPGSSAGCDRGLLRPRRDE